MDKSSISDSATLFQQSVARHQAGNIDEAIDGYRVLIREDPENQQVLYQLGIAEAQRGNYLESVNLLGELIINNPIPEAYISLGNALQGLMRFEEALKSYDKSIELIPDNPLAYYNRGNAFSELKRFDEALQSYNRAIERRPGGPVTYNNRGNVLAELKRFDEALQSFDQAIQLNPDYSDAHINRGVALIELKRFEEALQSFDRAIQLYPDDPVTYNNQGNAYKELKRFEDALQSYDRAILLNPGYSLAYSNRGTALAELKRFDDALLSFERAILLKSDYPDAIFYRGSALRELKRFDEALDEFERAINLKPDNNFWLGDLINLRLSCCDWRNFENNRNNALNGIIDNTRATDPFTTLLLTDSSNIQQKAAMMCVQDKYIIDNSTTILARYPRHDRIRLGYFSADYRDHPVLHLIVEMLEKHDRSRFELFGFSFGPESDDSWRTRAQKSFDQFFDVRFMSDQEAAQLARVHQIDIAVDLMGFTADSRTNIFAGRAAPVQVNYLGYPGTLGAGFIDYIIADETVIPESDHRNFTENIVYLPNSYLVTCRDRDVSRETLTRAEFNLPQDGFVFCCFNNNNKITPTMFDSWMRILRQVDGSVLWLFESNRWAADNLRREAEKRDVHAARLVFAQKIPLVEDHLNRIRHADLFLDTLPFNAHTTASDALRMGVPLVTLLGNAFAGRVAASLLKTLDLGELITRSAAEYEQLAVNLALDPDRLRMIRVKLLASIQMSPLFDSELFTRNIEKAYELMYERYQNDLNPDHMVVEAI
jgi:predicted O-linked N-acetylglucosamine transferase (SPINDLY family)